MIHMFKNNGYNIVLDVNSGSVHVVDDIAYDAVALYDEDPDGARSGLAKMHPELSEDEADGVIGEIESLKEAGRLFSDDIYEDYVNGWQDGGDVVKALCLHVAHDCNLSCRYCFAGKGEYHGESALMSREVGRKAIDFLIRSSGSRRNLEVDFFGGEPLMNFGVVKDVVAYARSLEEKHDKKFRFTLTTNGLLLDDEVIRFANEELSNLVLSIDGRKEVHDAMRPCKNGKGSYDAILPKLVKAARERNQRDYYVRGTFTHYNTDFDKDVTHLADLGFKQISVEPVVADPSCGYAITKDDIEGIYDSYDRLAKEMLVRKREGRGFNFFHFMIDLSGGPCVKKRLSGCGSGTEYLAVTPWGDLYPCHQFVGNEKFLLGNLTEGVKRKDICEKFKRCSVYSKQECKECFAKFFCSGGCAANAYNFTGDIGKPYEIGCLLEKKRVECALMLKAAEEDMDDM